LGFPFFFFLCLAFFFVTSLRGFLSRKFLEVRDCSKRLSAPLSLFPPPLSTSLVSPGRTKKRSNLGEAPFQLYFAWILCGEGPSPSDRPEVPPFSDPFPPIPFCSRPFFFPTTRGNRKEKKVNVPVSRSSFLLPIVPSFDFPAHHPFLSGPLSPKWGSFNPSCFFPRVGSSCSSPPPGSGRFASFTTNSSSVTFF